MKFLLRLSTLQSRFTPAKCLSNRLDVLDYKLSHYFEKSYATIESINANAGLLRQDAAQIQKQIAQMRFELNSGLKFLWQSQITDWQSICLSLTCH